MQHPPHNTPNAARLGLLAACGAGFLWGTGALIVNVLMSRHGFTPENISFWRFLVGAVVLLAVFARRSLWARVRPHLGLVMLAGTCMSMYVLCWFLGIERIGAAIPTLIALCLPPVLVTVWALMKGRERLDVSLVAGMAFSVASAALYAGFTLVSGRLSQDLGQRSTGPHA